MSILAKNLEKLTDRRRTLPMLSCFLYHLSNLVCMGREQQVEHGSAKGDQLGQMLHEMWPFLRLTF